MSPPRIFISYRREDSSGHAGRLYDVLADHFGSENVFIDVDTIRIGSDFAETIERALGDCDAVVAVIGRDWTTAAYPGGKRRLEDPGDFVRLELEISLARGISVIPVAVRGAAFPNADELPASLEPLARRQGIELRDSAWRDDVNRLIRRLEGLIRTAKESQPGRTTKWSRRPPVRAAIAAAVVALVAIGIAVAATDRGTPSSGGHTSGGHQNQSLSRLLAAIPGSVRPSCNSPSPDRVPTATASRDCSADNLDVYYYLFPSTAAMSFWYREKGVAPGVSQRSGGCRKNAFQGEATKEGRQLLCFFQNGDAHIVWIDPKAKIGAAANTYGMSGRRASTYLLEQLQSHT